MKRILALLLILVMLSSTVMADDTKEVLKVGITPDFPPFEYYEGEKLTGFDVEFMNIIGERIGYDVEFLTFSFEELYLAVAQGLVDCAISGITITEEREKLVDFTIPYVSLDKNENYAVMFPENHKLKANLASAAGESFVYNLVNDSISKLIADSTVEKLVEKYGLSTFNSDGVYENAVSENSSTENDLALEMSESIPGDWAQEDIKNAAYLKITDAKKYRYRSSITREEFCDLVYNTIKAVLNKTYTINTSFEFEDTDSKNAVILNRLGIVKGKTETLFAPDDFLTREEAATIIMRMINNLFPMPATEMWFQYDDIDEISQWALDSVQTISNLGIMTGVSGNSFAPKDTYTTEQAIVTLVRVCERAKAAMDNNDLGIIGGADGPTSIIVGEDINVIEEDGYHDFYTSISKNSAKVDDFYVNEALKLIEESGKLALDKDFVSLYTGNDEIINELLTLGSVDFGKPTDIFCFFTDKEQAIAHIKAMAGEEAENIDFEKMWKLAKRYNANYLASLVNGSYGAETIAALTILANSRGYIMPKDFKNNFSLYFQYDGQYSAIVSFSEYGAGVISANMSFVRNGEKDNMFRRLYEIYSVLGKDSLNIAKVQ